MNEGTRKIIAVTPEESSLVRAGTVIMDDAVARKKKSEEEAGSGIEPLLLFNSKAEANVVWEVDSLRRKYQKELGLSEPPILVAELPAEPSATTSAAPTQATALQTSASQHTMTLPSVPVGKFHFFERSNEKGPTHIQLENLLIGRVPLRRVGDTIYKWHETYFKRKSDADVLTLIREQLDAELSILGSANQLASVQTLLYADPRIEAVPLEDTSTNLLCLRNGLLDLNTLQLLRATPDFFFTSRIEVDWLGAQVCPKFDSFLQQIFAGNPVYIKRAWQALGYALVPDNRAKRFIVMQGVGNSGKSVLGNLISAFFDPSAVANVDIFKFRERFATAELVDKRVNISMDLPAGNLSDQAVGMLKKITGGDAVTVEEKYHSPRSAVINATLIFGTNHELRLWEFDEAFANRVLLIPFQYPVPEEQRDPKLLESLKAERSGILYRAILEYRELVENGYVFAGDDVISFQSQCVERGVVPPDGVAEFVSACCVMDAEHFTSTEQLHLAYLDFCREHHLPSLNDRGAFSRQFSAAVGFAAKREKQRVNGVPMNGYRGVMLAGGNE